MLEIGEGKISSDEVSQTAELGPSGWMLSFLPRRLLAAEQAIAGMQYAELATESGCTAWAEARQRDLARQMGVPVRSVSAALNIWSGS